VKLSQLNLIGPIRTQVQIRQKTVKHTSADKLYDAWISLLAGAHGLVEINTRLRTDPGFQQAFGRSAQDQSSIPTTRGAEGSGHFGSLDQAQNRVRAAGDAQLFSQAGSSLAT
jgi:hypothetical protein